MAIDELRHRINQLCGQALEAKPEELDSVLDQLRAAVQQLREHMSDLAADRREA
jgi:hypothetical protein